MVVDVDVLVEEDVEVLLVVELLVVGAMVVVVVEAIVVLVDVVLVDADTRVLVPAADSLVREGELLGASQPEPARTRPMSGSITSLVN